MNVIEWLKSEDLFTKYHVEKYLLENYYSASNIKEVINTSDFAKTIISRQDLKTSLWDEGIYSPKYTSTHYSLLILCELGIDLSETRYLKTINILLENMWYKGGKVSNYRHQDMCVVAMMIRICSQAKMTDQRLYEMIDYVLEYKMSDGGWNCSWERRPYPKQSSLHTTLSVLEAFANLKDLNYSYRLDEINEGCKTGSEYILTKRLFKSVRTGEIIHKDMLKFPFPHGWKYDMLRALYVMANLNIPYDERMEDGLNNIINRLDDYGRIKADSLSVGKYYGIYRRANQLSPFNTYRVLLVLKKYKYSNYCNFINKNMI
ncbi:MAG: hypothetical protein CVV60_04900 [Tenericutes bacterium HGW-Tenericutes-5]|jgi:hypothetical protein|nr:MAG: hypothetical protein CVV60_04900 [Tenericutes bacterium HGW-Tenericutes-5]